MQQHCLKWRLKKKKESHGYTAGMKEKVGTAPLAVREDLPQPVHSRGVGAQEIVLFLIKLTGFKA